MIGLLLKTDGSGLAVELAVERNDQAALARYYELLDCTLVEIVSVFGRDDALVVADEEAKMVTRTVEVDGENVELPGLAPNKIATELVYGPGLVAERQARKEAALDEYRKAGFAVIDAGSPGEESIEPYIAGDVVVIGRPADCPADLLDKYAKEATTP